MQLLFTPLSISLFFNTVTIFGLNKIFPVLLQQPRYHCYYSEIRLKGGGVLF